MNRLGDIRQEVAAFVQIGPQIAQRISMKKGFEAEGSPGMGPLGRPLFLAAVAGEYGGQKFERFPHTIRPVWFQKDVHQARTPLI